MGNNVNPVVCRRVEDSGLIPCIGDETLSVCSGCQQEIVVEPGLAAIEPKLCLYCAAVSYPETVLFVELPPDEFGRRSLAKGIKEVLEAKAGEWHKNGVWHDQQFVLRDQ